MSAPPAPRRRLAPALAGAGMIGVIALSNILVQYPFTPLGLEALLTWAAFVYPATFLITDLVNRFHGPRAARMIVYLAFPPALLLSAALGPSLRVALASGAAFLIAQLLDIRIFHRLRHYAWWRAPLVSSALASLCDTALFFALAFAGTTPRADYGLGPLRLQLPLWIGWAAGDLAVKLLLAPALLVPYRALLAVVKTRSATTQTNPPAPQSSHPLTGPRQ